MHSASSSRYRDGQICIDLSLMAFVLATPSVMKRWINEFDERLMRVSPPGRIRWWNSIIFYEISRFVAK